jgi:proline iminopeptidase
MSSVRQRFLEFRRSLPRTPRLERQTVRVRGLSFAVFTSPPSAAELPPLVCVNGGMLFDHSMLWPALSPLAAKRQLVLYDQRGRGASQEPPDPSAATIDDDAADLAALRRALGIRRWDILGHSWGGGISMLAAAIDQAGTRRLVLVDSVSPTSEWMAPMRQEVIARLQGTEREAYLAVSEEALKTPDAEVQAQHARATYPAWFADAEFARFFRPPQVTSRTGAAVLAHLRREGYDWRDRLSALRVPTLVMHAERDPFPEWASRQVAAVLPESRFALVPDSGHMPFWEAPRRFFALIESFLDASSPSRVSLPP